MSHDSEQTPSAPQPLRPGVRTGQLPPFHELSEYIFQDLCRDLMGVEPNITWADNYGDRGQTQRGIDVIAYAKGSAVEVVQCKREQSFSAADIKKVRKEFFKYWSFWKGKSVKRFILAVACRVSNRKCQDQVLIERPLFAKKGIAYELWGPTQLHQRLRSQPAIVREHFTPSDFWVREICGSRFVSPSTPDQPVGISPFVHNQLDLLANRLSEELTNRLDDLKKDWHRGQRHEVEAALNAIRQDTTRWSTLSAEMQARVLRYLACLRLELENDYVGARRLHEESARVHPKQDDLVLRALLTFSESGVDAALQVLADTPTPTAKAFRASLLLECGRAEEALESASGDDPDALRIRAFALALTGNIDDALKTINGVLTDVPDREGLSFATAAINYLSAIAPSARPNRIPFAPEPIEWGLVCKDEGSQQRLAAAAEHLERLLTVTSGEQYKSKYQAWLIACLANRVAGQDQAAQHVARVLAAQPTFWPAIIWSLVRGYKLDLDTAVAALTPATTGENVDCMMVVALAACEMARGQYDRAIAVLESNEAAFVSAKAMALWLFWLAQVMIRDGKVERACVTLTQRDPEQTLAPHAWALVVAVGGAKSKGDTKAHLFRLFEATSEATILVDACEAAAREKDWAWIAAQAHLLKRHIGTTDAISLLAKAQYNADDFSGALETIDEHVRQFGSAALSPQLRRVRLAACSRVGLLSPAISDAEKLAEEIRSAESRMDLARLYFESGNMFGVCLVAQQMLTDGQLGATGALQLAFYVKGDDQKLAKRLVECALTTELPDELVGPAFALGTELAVGPAIKPIAARFFALGEAGKAGIQAVSINDAAVMVAQWRQQATQVVNNYQTGFLPIHILASQNNVPLARIYGRQFSNGSGLRRGSQRGDSVLAYYGGRPLLSSVSLPKRRPAPRLNLDITSILLASRLGILALLIEKLGPLRIPKATISALNEMRERLTPSQRRLSAAEAIIEAAKTNSLVVLETPEGRASDLDHLHKVVESCTSDCSQVVTFASLCREAIDLHTGIQAVLFTSGSVVVALRDCGPLSHSDSERYLDALGAEADRIGDNVLIQGKPLLFHANTIELIAEVGLLDVLLTRFQVHIEATELARLQAEIDGSADAETDAQFVAEVVAELNQRLADNTVQVIDERGAAKNEAFKVQGPLDDVLNTLLSFKQVDGDVIVADDRFLNSYRTRGSIPITTLPEVLSGLHNANEIGDAAFYSILLRLRAGWAYYLPIEAAEIAFHLDNASVRDGKLVETEALAILRRYVASVASSLQWLRAPKDPSKSLGETTLVMVIGRAVLQSVRMAWTPNRTQDEAIAKASWLLTNLYCPFHMLYRKSRGEVVDDARSSVAYDFTSLLFEGLWTQSVPDESRKDYLKWLEGIIDRKVELDPALLHEIVRAAKTHFRSLLDTTERDGSRVTGVKLSQRWFYDLPITIRDELENDRAFLKEIGIERRAVVGVGPLVFERSRFFAGAESAINGSLALVDIEGGNAQAEFRPASMLDRLPTFAIIHDGGCMPWLDDYLSLLSSDDGVVRGALRLHPEWLDGFGDRRTQLVSELLALSPRERLDRIKELISASPAVFYARLEVDLHRRQAFEFGHMLSLAPASVLSHLALSAEKAEDPDFESAGAALCATYGVVAAFARLSTLPVPMPKSVLDPIGRADKDELQTIVHALLKACRTPIARLHLVRALAMVADRDRAYRRLTRKGVRDLLSDRSVEVLAALLQGIRWVWDVYARKAGGETYADWQRLAVAWAHAGQLITALLTADARPQWVRETFKGRLSHVDVETFSTPQRCIRDVAHPRQQGPVQILLTGLAYALDGHDDLKADCHAVLDAFFVRPMADITTPRYEVFNNGPDGANALGSFLGRPYLECFASLICKTFHSQPVLGPEDLCTFVADSVRRINDAPNDALTWGLAGIWSGRLDPGDSDIRDPVLAAVDGIDLASLWVSDPQCTLQAINVIGETLASGSDTGHAQRFLERLVDFVKHQHLGDNESLNERLLSLIVNTGAALVMPRAGMSKVGEYGLFLENIAQASPSFTASIRQIAEMLVAHLPVSLAADVWPTVVRLRAI